LSKDYEFYEQSPLKRFPLLEVEGRYFCYSPVLLVHSTNSFVFDTLKQADPNGFMNSFGTIFEKYIASGFSYSKVPFISEKEIQATIGRLHKVVDFIVFDDDTAILIDAKGVELPVLGMLTHLHDVLSDKTRTSILKGVSQACATWHALATHSRIGEFSLGNRVPYLLVVTYKQLYLGTGVDFLTHVASDFYADLLQQYGGRSPIPPEHIYFISASDFDYLMETIHKGQSLKTILVDSVARDSQLSTKRFIFSQHLMQYGTNIPVYLEREFDSIVNTIRTNFSE
jgi:hypothetical protein